LMSAINRMHISLKVSAQPLEPLGVTYFLGHATHEHLDWPYPFILVPVGGSFFL